MNLSFNIGKQIVNNLGFNVENWIFISNNHVKLYCNKKGAQLTI